jgi:glycosyltransferase involved in cell wall biosynthesis
MEARSRSMSITTSLEPDRTRERVRRVAFITATEPEPRSYGKTVVIGGILDHLRGRLGARNVHVILIGRRNQERPEPPYSLHVLDKPSSLTQLGSVARHLIWPAAQQVLQRRLQLRPRPSPEGAGYRGVHALQEAVLRSPRLARSLRALLDEIDPDLELWDTLRVGQYAPLVTRRRRALYADDLFSERYASMLQQDARAGANPGGEFQKLLPAPARHWLGKPAIYRPLLRLERRLVAASEARQPHWFDATYLIGADETTRLGARCRNATIATLPPLLREPRRLRRECDFQKPNFTFIGGFDYAPNLDGIDWFLACCRQAVLSRLPDVSITVVGAGTQAGLPSAAAWNGRVRFLGFVPDLDALIARSVALLSPLRSGSGVKIKVLEALAHGLPVVATPAGVQGIASPAQSGCLVAEAPEDIAALMEAACEPATNAALAAAARRAWDERYAPALVRRRYDSLFGLADEKG